MLAGKCPIAVFLLLAYALCSSCQSPEPQGEGEIHGRVVLPYDHAWRANPDLTFRLAIMVKAKDGMDSEDFFASRPSTPESLHEIGVSRMGKAVPRIFPDAFTALDGDVFTLCTPTDHLPPKERLDRNMACFLMAFPNHGAGDFELTFQTFADGRYMLEGMPEGIAFVWIQTPFDGNRITQFPLMLHFPDYSERSRPFDIRCEELGVVFHTL